ncbi:rod shape-determining protein [Acidovorax sp.]|uniref:rod shape-determining protein n=1 Tax=Acidovorax sp. TaxID=1872122 RepID=UPI0025C4B375|nr:rod shape-determining protein [Acidovorax sp.]MBW8461128.1 rod shape-determining protein [Acidovorax sp.]
MLHSLLPVYYVQLSPTEVSVLNVKSNVLVRDLPEVAVSPGAKPTVLAVGSAARQAAAQSGGVWANPFGHPRSLVSDFVLAEAVLKHFVIHAAPAGWKRLIAPSPRMVMHPRGEPEGGYTQVEIRALRELGMAVGAALVTVWQGRSLTTEELLSGRFPLEGRVLT